MSVTTVRARNTAEFVDVCASVSVRAQHCLSCSFLLHCNTTERYFKWGEDGADNYLAYKVAGRSEETDEFALIGPFFKDPATDAERDAIDELVKQQFASVLRQCHEPGFKQVCTDSLAVLLHHKAWLSQNCPYLATQPFMDGAHAYLCERVFVGFEEDPQCPVGRTARGVPDHIRSRIQLQREVRCLCGRVCCVCVHMCFHVYVCTCTWQASSACVCYET